MICKKTGGEWYPPAAINQRTGALMNLLEITSRRTVWFQLRPSSSRSLLPRTARVSSSLNPWNPRRANELVAKQMNARAREHRSDWGVYGKLYLLLKDAAIITRASNEREISANNYELYIIDVAFSIKLSCKKTLYAHGRKIISFTFVERHRYFSFSPPIYLIAICKDRQCSFNK